MTEGNRGDDLAGFASVALMGGELQKENLGSLTKAEGGKSLSGQVDWVGVKTKYFFACAIPEDPGKTRGFSAALTSGTEQIEAELRAGFGCMPHRGVKHSGSTKISVALVSPEERNFSIYIGPIDFEELKDLEVGAEKVVDFGWSWIAPLSRLLFRVLKSLHAGIGNWGLVIILFSIIMKIIFYPLTHRGTKSMREMQRLQPKIKQLQKQYKNDPKKLNAEMARIGASPIKQLAGCLPLLLQMPIFIALYSVLRTTIELRRASFIGFWIRDLSVQDPYYILPLLMGAFMLLQSLFTAVDPRQRWSTLFMPIVITIIFLNFPAGLVLYWLVNNIFSVVEHFLVARKETPVST
jgi:YidC/Oxa1 family membrane protein insertase